MAVKLGCRPLRLGLRESASRQPRRCHHGGLPPRRHHGVLHEHRRRQRVVWRKRPLAALLQQRHPVHHSQRHGFAALGTRHIDITLTRHSRRASCRRAHHQSARCALCRLFARSARAEDARKCAPAGAPAAARLHLCDPL